MSDVYKSGVPRYEEQIYMEKRLLAFIRAWPDVPKDLRPAYCWLSDAGILTIDPDASYDFDPDLGGDPWPGGLKLSTFGERVKAVCDAQTYNFWLLPALLDLLPVEHLMNRTPPADAYIRMLRLDWNSRDVRRYISMRMRELDGTIAAIARPARDLLSMMEALGEALDSLTSALDRK